jgi:hypothetical protein
MPMMRSVILKEGADTWVRLRAATRCHRWMAHVARPVPTINQTIRFLVSRILLHRPQRSR